MLGGFEMQLLAKMFKEYAKADKKTKGALLSQYCRLAGVKRDAAIKRFSRYRFPSRYDGIPSRIKRRKKYDSYCKSLIFNIWILADMICAERLITSIDIYIEQLSKELGYANYSPKTVDLVKNISLSTLKRIISSFPKPSHKKHKGKCDLYRAIRQRADFGKYASKSPGYIEIDYVEHKGESNFSPFAITGNYTDIYSQWIARAAGLGKNRASIEEIDKEAMKKFMFPVKECHPDNEKTILSHLYNQIKEGKANFSLSRSRPYKKNDNTHVEQKNGDKIRKPVGYHRYETEYQVYLLNRIYAAGDLIDNFFIPSMKLKAKIKDEKGRTLRRIYEKAKTPYKRIMESGKVPQKYKKELRETYERLNLVELRKELKGLLEKLQESIGGRRRKDFTDKINELTMPPQNNFTDILK